MRNTIALLVNLFKAKPQKSDLEKYLDKQEFHTVADVEFHTRRFDTISRGKALC
jgi:hypothetical protein